MLAKNFDISKIKFSTIKTLDNGGKMIYLNYNGGINPFYVTTPEAEIIWDPNYFADDGKGPEDSKTGKYSMTFSMNQSMKGMDEFKEKFLELDKCISLQKLTVFFIFRKSTSQNQ